MVATGPGPAGAFVEQTARLLHAIAMARAQGRTIEARDWAQLEDAVLRTLRESQMRAYLAEVDANRVRQRLLEVRAALDAMERSVPGPRQGPASPK